MADILQEEWATMYYDLDPYQALNIKTSEQSPSYTKHTKRNISMGPSMQHRKILILKEDDILVFEDDILVFDNDSLRSGLDGNRSWAVVAIYSPEWFTFQIGGELVHDSDIHGPLFHNPVFPELATLCSMRVEGKNLQALLVESIIPPRFKDRAFDYWQATPKVNGVAVKYANVEGFSLASVEDMTDKGIVQSAMYSLPNSSPGDVVRQAVTSRLLSERSAREKLQAALVPPTSHPCLCTLQ